MTRPMATPQTRPRNAATTREMLLDAARPLFAQQGYEATTVGQIAQVAGFSPNLITRYFGGKEGLFLAATRTRLDLDRALSGGSDGFGERLASQMVERWEQQGQADPLLALLRSASSSPAALEALGEFLEAEATAPLTRALMEWGLSEGEATDRANAVQSFVLGTVITRRMLHTGPVAAASSVQLRAWLTEVLQRLIEDGPTRPSKTGHLPTSAGHHHKSGARDTD
jgi:AcrR family transcriptional regulator